MKANLTPYQNLRICVALSGGRDSMALVHYLTTNAAKYSLTISAVNCDHSIRGDASIADSRFVADYCRANEIPLISFKRGSSEASEAAARTWRYSCFKSALAPTILPNGTYWQGADVIATAHHIEDNAETVLFNLARGSSLAGMQGICDSVREGARYIRPLISCSRTEIEDYIFVNKIPYVDDATNFTDEYTRNKIRHYALSALESAVPGASENIFRFSRLAAEYYGYFNALIEERGILTYNRGAAEIAITKEQTIFNIAARQVILEHFARKDFEKSHFDSLYNLQFLEVGKRFEFLNLIAYRTSGGIAIVESAQLEEREIPFALGDFELNGCVLTISERELKGEGKLLQFDFDSIPEGAVIRTMKPGDSFKKFGGGTKSLGDFFTDKKVPLYLRQSIPLIAIHGDILAVVGVEIADKIKITNDTKRRGYILCRN